jgi:hypothetical protein
MIEHAGFFYWASCLGIPTLFGWAVHGQIRRISEYGTSGLDPILMTFLVCAPTIWAIHGGLNGDFLLLLSTVATAIISLLLLMAYVRAKLRRHRKRRP